MQENNQLQKLNTGLSINTIDDIARLSKIFYESGMFDDIKSMAQAGVKIMAGAELGITPFQSITGVHIIKGKPTIGAGLMASMLDSHPEYDFEVLEQTDKVCAIKFFKNGKAKGVSTFTEEHARKAGTQNMGKFPANMLYARAMSNGVKWYAPGLFAGPVYVPEEMQEPETIQTTYEEVKAPEQPKTELKPLSKEEAKEATDKIAGEVAEIKWASDKQKELIASLLNSHHVPEEYRQSVVDIETTYEGGMPLPEFERVYEELQEFIKQGVDKDKNTAASDEQIEEIGRLLFHEKITEKERTSGFDKLQKPHSIAQARAKIKSLTELIEERKNQVEAHGN